MSAQYKAISDLATAIIALQKDPKGAQAIVDEASKNFALKDDMIKKYNEALDTIAQAKKVEAENKKAAELLKSQQDDLEAAKSEMDKKQADINKQAAANQESTSMLKSYEGELKILKESLAAKEADLNTRSKALDDRSLSLDQRENTVSDREAVFKQAAGLIA